MTGIEFDIGDVKDAPPGYWMVCALCDAEWLQLDPPQQVDVLELCATCAGETA
jgi:hypothetical protein